MIKEYPILEFDDDKRAVIEPHKLIKEINIPECCIICFFNDVIERLKIEGKAKVLKNLRSEIGVHPIYEVEHLGRKMSVFHPGVGAPLAVGMLEEVIALGARKFIACGGAGVLDRNIAVGNIVIPKSAVRDEGTSYHYMEPSREVYVDEKGIKAIEKVLTKHKCSYILSKTWTTDALYRETINKVTQRKKEGCLTVEMECSAFCAVAKFRKVIFAQILYGGDAVDCEEWDSRNWTDRTEIREKIFWFAAESCLEIES